MRVKLRNGLTAAVLAAAVPLAGCESLEDMLFPRPPKPLESARVFEVDLGNAVMVESKADPIVPIRREDR